MIRKLISRVFRLPSGKRGAPQPKVIPLTQHGVRRDVFNVSALKVTSRLQEAGFEAFIVGGAVRDALLGLTPKDFDIATNATPEQVRHVFRRSRIIGRRFKIVHVLMGPETLEVTTYRGGAETITDTEGRILHDNVFGTQAEDASRRDFTINALFYNPTDETIVDYHRGVRDIQARRLVMIGQPVQRYREDPVRMLRAVRLAAKLNLSIEEDTRRPIRELSLLLENVPAARLFDEMLKLLFSGHAYACIKRLRDEGLHRGVFPLLDAIDEDATSADFLRLALESTDRRILENKPVSVGFLLATLLWHQVRDRWIARQEQGVPAAAALAEAMQDAESDQDDHLAIPRRYAMTMREIWSLQVRFLTRSGARPAKLLEQPRFRAAYDFLCLRAAVGEVPQELVDWWTTFQEAHPDDRGDLLLQEPANGAARKRRRRRKKPAAGGGATEGGAAE